jgi:hypothetical protein
MNTITETSTKPIIKKQFLVDAEKHIKERMQDDIPRKTIAFIDENGYEWHIRKTDYEEYCVRFYGKIGDKHLSLLNGKYLEWNKTKDTLIESSSHWNSFHFAKTFMGMKDKPPRFTLLTLYGDENL